MIAETSNSPRYEILGELIFQRRQALGMEQKDLACRLDVGQKTVNNWEGGKSRPRRNSLRVLARELALEEEKLVEVGRYQLSTPSSSYPVSPLAITLPLHDLTEEQFEELMTDVLSTLYPDAHTTRFGGRGHKQDGIDILVADKGAILAIGQCKRHQRLGPAEVQKVINEVSISAPTNYLFLSRLNASPKARLAANEHPNWELWDGNDISRHIRGLPRERALRIVDTFFPQFRESFLGVAAPGPWLFPEEYFDVADNSLFNHEWSLAGRQDQLTDIASVAYANEKALSLITGTAGIGKTRFLKSLAEAAPPASEIRVLPGDAPVSAADFELLPSPASLTVMIDDAHECSEVKRILTGIWLRNPEARIVLATRPYWIQYLKSELVRHNLLPNSFVERELTELHIDDTITLAREALGSKAPESVVYRLATLTTDFPFATVLGGTLISQGKISPNALEQSDAFRPYIMTRFRKAVMSNSLSDDSRTRDKVLNALAAVQPFRTNDESARDSLSAIVDKPYDEVHRHLRNLEETGVVRRRGDSIRVVPDLLGDIVLAEAAFDAKGHSSTGFLERIERSVTGNSSEHLFINASRVDQQLRYQSNRERNLADPLWRSFSRRLKKADMIDRRELVTKTLTQVAYFQPERVFETARWLIDNPTTEIDKKNHVWTRISSTDYSSVIRALPAVLERAALNAEVLPEALAVMWELVVDHDSDEALHSLKELAKIDSTKPAFFIHQIIDVASTWFSNEPHPSPFQVLEPMLATEGEEVRAHGHTLVIRRYGLEPQGVAPIRQRLINLAFEELRSLNLRRSGAAIRFLASALHYPTGTFGASLPEETREEWAANFAEILRRLHMVIVDADLDPAVLVGIQEALSWHVNYGEGSAHEIAEKTVRSLPMDTEFNVALALHDGWGRLVRGFKNNYEASMVERQRFLKSTVDGLAGMTDDEVIDLLVVRLKADQDVHEMADSYPQPFFAELVKARPSIVPLMLTIIDTSPFRIFDSVLATVLGQFALADPAAALEEIHILIDNESRERRRSAAQALGSRRAHRALHPGELDLLVRLATDADHQVRREAAIAAQLLARDNPAAPARILADLRFSDDLQVADQVFFSFSRGLGISWESFSEPELDHIRQELLLLPQIDNHAVMDALADRSATDPTWVLDLLKDRVERAEAKESIRGYTALPFSWAPQLQIRHSPAFLSHLRGVLSWVGDAHDSHWNRANRGALFAAVANEYDAPVIQMLADTIKAGTTRQVLAVSAVLSKVPRTFVWDQSHFVSTALNVADQHGKEVLETMCEALWSATTLGARHGHVGEPFPESIEQRDRSREIARSLAFGSIGQRFYSDLMNAAERDIERERESDLPPDGRAW